MTGPDRVTAPDRVTGRRAGLAVIGTGWWATTVHLPAVVADPDSELIAVCDPDPARADAAARSFGAVPIVDPAQLWRRDDVDGVVIATPHHTHHELARAALSAGKHVLVEKPMATRAVEAWELVELARRRRHHLAVGLTYHHAPVAAVVQQAVADRIGELTCVNADFSSGTERLFAVTDPGDARLDDPGVPHGTTYSDPAAGGGQAHTQLTHLLGGLCWATGRQATDVSAIMADRGLAVDVVDALCFRLAGGALGVASSTGTTADGVPGRHRIRFHGTAGMVEWDLVGAAATIHTGNGSERIDPPSGRPSYHADRVAPDFTRLILGTGPNRAPGSPAAASVALIEAAHTAARTGAREPVTQGPSWT